MAELRLHLDANISSKALQDALVKRGHDVTRTPCEWMPEDVSDEAQLLGAAVHGRAIFTFDVHHFVPLPRRFADHHGVILASPRGWTASALIHALDRLLKETDAADWEGQVRWLNQWRD